MNKYNILGAFMFLPICVGLLYFAIELFGWLLILKLCGGIFVLGLYLSIAFSLLDKGKGATK